MDLSPILNIDVGGKAFRVMRSTIMKYPESTLARVISGKDTDNMIISNNVFFFDRNPDYFSVVLDFMRSGKLYTPPNLCEEQLADEMEFWRIGQKPSSLSKPPSPLPKASPIRPTTPPQDIQSTLLIEDDMQPTLIMNPDFEPTLIMNEEVQPTLIMNEEVQPTLIMNHDIQPTLIMNPDIQPTLIMNEENTPTRAKPNNAELDPLQSSEIYSGSSFGNLNNSLRLSTPAKPVNIDGLMSLVSQITPSPKDTPTFPSHSINSSGTLSEEDPLTQSNKPKRGKLGRKSGKSLGKAAVNLKDSLDSLDEPTDFLASRVEKQEEEKAKEPLTSTRGGKRGRTSTTIRKGLRDITDSFISEEGKKEAEPVALPAKRANLPKILNEAESASSEEEHIIKKPKLEEFKHPASNTIENPRIIFSGVSPADQKKYETVISTQIIHKLNGELVTSLDKATHLVQKEFARTMKSLEALVRGLDIVSVNWVTDSSKHQVWQDPHNYNIITQEVQREYDFNLQEIHRKAALRSKEYVRSVSWNGLLYQSLCYPICKRL